jgi:hypothetical protein
MRLPEKAIKVFAARHDRFDGPTGQRTVFDHASSVRKYELKQ